MKAEQLIALLAKFPATKHVDVEIGGALIPITSVEPSGECATGVKLVLGKECQVCDSEEKSIEPNGSSSTTTPRSKKSNKSTD